VLILIYAIGCSSGSDDDDSDDYEPRKDYDVLVEYEHLKTVSVSLIQATSFLYPELADILSGGDPRSVNVYSVTYKTTNVEGEDILASGAVLLPISDEVLPLLSYHHGTFTEDLQAPSHYYKGEEVLLAGTLFASLGYAVVMPDYLGYHVSSDYPHPYEHAKTLASASFDMLQAAKELLNEEEININDKLFLTGYSEGGGATMALHHHIEKNSDWKVSMSAPGGGAYNKTATMTEYLALDEEVSVTGNALLLLYSYDWIYNIDRSWSDYVNPPYVEILEGISSPLEYKHADVSLNPKELMKADFVNGLLDGSDTEFLAALADNDIYNWSPKYPITLIYGTADQVVFPVNSESAYLALKENGAQVNIIPIVDASHSSAYLPYMLLVYELFESLKDD